MRVLAVAQALLEGGANIELGRKRRAAAGACAEKSTDGLVVLRGVGEGLGRQAVTRGGAHGTGTFEFVGDERVVVGIADHRDVAVVLGRGAQQRRSADVDVLDRFVEGHVAACHRLRERIEIDDHEIDRLDTVLAHHGIVDAAPRENAAMHFRVQGLHPPLHHLGHPGMAGDVTHVEAGVAQGLCRAAGGEQAVAGLDQGSGESRQATLVRCADQRPRLDPGGHCSMVLGAMPFTCC